MSHNGEITNEEEEGRGVPGVGVEWEDKMETFFLVRSLPFVRARRNTDILMGHMQSETLKYLYLLFADDSVLPFDSKCPLVQCPLKGLLTVLPSPV